MAKLPDVVEAGSSPALFALALLKATGNSIAARIAMMAMTTSNSMSVNPA